MPPRTVPRHEAHPQFFPAQRKLFRTRYTPTWRMSTVTSFQCHPTKALQRTSRIKTCSRFILEGRRIISIRRSGLDSTLIWVIAPSLAPVQTTVLAPMPTKTDHSPAHKAAASGRLRIIVRSTMHITEPPDMVGVFSPLRCTRPTSVAFKYCK